MADTPTEGDAEYATRVLDALQADLGYQENPKESAVEAKPKECQTCGGPAKYKCPGCGTASCGLDCVRSHKEALQCDGKRKVTTFVPLSEFTDEQLLIDYRFLEDANRVKDGSSRDKTKRTVKQLPKKVSILLRAAKKRDMVIKIMPSGMQRRTHNNTFYNIKEDCIYWHIEWRFGDAKFEDSNVAETRTVGECLQKYVTTSEYTAIHQGIVSTRAALKPYVDAGLSRLKVFMKVEGSQSNAVRYLELGLDHPLRMALSGTTLVEYPTLCVALPEDAHKFPLQHGAPAEGSDSSSEGGDDSESTSSGDSSDDEESSSSSESSADEGEGEGEKGDDAGDIGGGDVREGQDEEDKEAVAVSSTATEEVTAGGGGEAAGVGSGHGKREAEGVEDDEAGPSKRPHVS